MRTLQIKKTIAYGCCGFSLLLGGVLSSLPSALAQAPALAPRASGSGGVAVDAKALELIRQAQERLDDADALLSLTQDGALLYSRDKLKLTGYQYCNQAVALAEQGEFRLSIRAASKALHLAQVGNDAQLLARALRDLAIAYSYSGQLEKAEQFAQQALQGEAGKDEQVAGPAYKVLGDVETRKAHYDGAVRHYEAALKSASPRYQPLVQASLVNALIELGQLERAAALLEKLTLPKDAVDLVLQARRMRAKLLLAQGQAAQARDIYQELTSQRAGPDSAYFRLWAWEGVSRSEAALGNMKASAEALSQALQDVDRVRSRFRSDEFKMGLFSDVQSLFEQAVVRYAALGDAEKAFEISEHSRSRALLDAVRGRHALPTAMQQVQGLENLRKVLAADERIVEFHSAANELWIWIVSTQGLQQHRIAISREDLAKVVEAFRSSITKGQASAVTIAEQLGSLLIEPLNLPSQGRLVVVPHGPLHYLPFQALRINGKYLIEQQAMSVAPSASIAASLAASPTRLSSSLVAFGNPRIGDEYDLPGAEREVQQISPLFKQQKVYLGAQATKTTFEQMAGNAPLVHVAAHAQADLVDPLYSRILLANENGQQRFLESHEILKLSLQKTALVTLSACESGLGKVAQGDEVLGFPRSFLSAGSSALIASLWPVADEATPILMTTLYQQLTQGADLQKAMQAGQLAVLAQPRMAHPFFWAPFNLMGNWRIVLDPSVSTASDASMSPAALQLAHKE